MVEGCHLDSVQSILQGLLIPADFITNSQLVFGHGYPVLTLLVAVCKVLVLIDLLFCGLYLSLGGVTQRLVAVSQLFQFALHLS